MILDVVMVEKILRRWYLCLRSRQLSDLHSQRLARRLLGLEYDVNLDLDSSRHWSLAAWLWLQLQLLLLLL